MTEGSETRTAAALVTRMNDAFDEAARTPAEFEMVRDALTSRKSFQEVADRLGGELRLVQLELISPEIECDYTGLAVTTMDGGPVFRGHEGWIEMWHLWFEPWSWYEWADREIVALDDQHALLDATAKCTGRASGVDVEIPQSGYWTARDGQLVAYRAFDSREQTLAAYEAEKAAAR